MKAKWAILLYDLGISGGANVIFEHASYAVSKGVEVSFVSIKRQTQEQAAWHRSAAEFKYITLEETQENIYDVAIATEWRSAFDIYRLTARKYIYFVQSIESRFFADDRSMFAYIANNSYELPLPVITEAGWIKEYLEELYGIAAGLIRNGIDKELFALTGNTIENRNPEKIRFLVEGSVNNWLKNVKKTVELCNDAGVEELWLVTPDEIDEYPGVDRVFCKVPMSEMPAIYRSCDVIVKLSLVEGMFGPPLEMFHCGGTAIVYDIEGAEEYIEDNVNAIVVKKNDERGVVKAICRLKEDRELLCALKKGAAKTAENWIDWRYSSETFYQAIELLPIMTDDKRRVLDKKGEYGSAAYRTIDKVFGAIPSDDRFDECIGSIGERRLFLYGAGALCRNYVIRFAEYDCVIDAIVVSNSSDNPKSVFGHRVICIDQLLNDREDIVVFITTEKNYEEIHKGLIEKGFKYVF